MKPFKIDISKARILSDEEAKAFYKELDEDRLVLSEEALSGKRKITVSLPEEKEEK